MCQNCAFKPFKNMRQPRNNKVSPGCDKSFLEFISESLGGDWAGSEA